MIKLTHKFIKHAPDKLEDGVLYISIEYSTVIHKCCCGCGEEVVTPLSPTDWKLIYDGETVSLYPSIGNWSFKCQSHYFITNSRVQRAPNWTKSQIERARKCDELIKKEYYKNKSKSEK
jgi:hypothetical protein